MFRNPFHRSFRRRNDGSGHVAADLLQRLRNHRQGRLRELPHIRQNVGAQLRQEIGAQVFNHLNVVFQGVGLPLKGGICRAGGFVHFRRLAGQVFGLVACHSQHRGLCLHRGEQASKRQFVASHSVL